MDPNKRQTEQLNKDIFDIRYDFCHCGMEIFHGFRKNTFKLTLNSETWITYVKKVQDEL